MADPVLMLRIKCSCGKETTFIAPPDGEPRKAALFCVACKQNHSVQFAVVCKTTPLLQTTFVEVSNAAQPQ